PTQSHDDALQLFHRVHLERVNQRRFARAETARRGIFLGPAGDGRGFLFFLPCPCRPGGGPANKDAGSCGSILDPTWLLTWSRGWWPEAPLWRFRSLPPGRFMP